MTQNRMITSFPFNVGITGGIGSGKSEVSRYLTALGYPVIDADRIAREVVEPGEIGLLHIVEVFGEGVLNFDHTLNRKRLGEMIFNNDVMRKRLNDILHPLIRMRMRSEALRYADEAVIFFDVPLLFETDSRSNYDEVVLVYANDKLTLQRIMLRDGISEDLAMKKIKAQIPLEVKRSLSDYVISNERDIDALLRQVDFYLKFLHDRMGYKKTT